MLRIRVIPVLLLDNGGLTKTVKFRDGVYVGDPVNAVKIFNEKGVDEIVILDISASRKGRGPDINMIREIAGEAFMPLAYGGGISRVEDAKEIFKCGVEKVIINSNAYRNPRLISDLAAIYGRQSVVLSMDVKKKLWGGYSVWVDGGQTDTGLDPVAYAVEKENAGAGEIFINSIDRDGTMKGYDLELLRKVSSSVSVPVIACGGAASADDFRTAVSAGASAVAAGSMFVFHGNRSAVLISFPSGEVLEKKLYSLEK